MPRINDSDSTGGTDSSSSSSTDTSDSDTTATDIQRQKQDQLTNNSSTSTSTPSSDPVFNRPRPPGVPDDAPTNTASRQPETDPNNPVTQGPRPDGTETSGGDTGGQSSTEPSVPDDINQGRRASNTDSTEPSDSSGTPTDAPTSPPSTNSPDTDISPVAPDGRRVPTEDDPDGDGVAGEFQGSYVENNGIETQDTPIGERARQVEQSAIESTPYLDDADEVRVNRSGELELTIEGKEARDAYQRQQVKQNVAANNPGLTASEVQVDLDAAQGNRVSLTDTGQAQVAGLVAAPRMGGRRAIQRSSLRQRAADNAGNAVTVDEVSTSFSNGQASVDVNPRGGVTTIASQQGGRQRIQEQSLEAAFARDAGNAVSSGEVDVDLSGTDPSATVNERTPVVADRQGGRRSIQRTSIANEIASGVDGLSAREVAPNLTSSGANPGLTMAAQRVRIEQQLAEGSSELEQDDFNVTFDDSSNPNAELTDAARRERLREKARSQNPNAENIDIVQEGDKLVAKIERENDVERTIRLGQNFVRDPIGSVVEGGSDIVSGLANDTGTFVSGRVRGIKNPGETYDWAAGGLEENTIDPVVSGVESGIETTQSIVSNPVNSVQSGARGAAGGLVDTVSAASELNADIVGGGINLVDSQIDKLDSGATGKLGAAAVPVVVSEPTLVGETVLAVGAGTVVVGGLAFEAGQQAGNAYDDAFNTTMAAGEVEVGEPKKPEISVPEKQPNSTGGELSINEDTGQVQREIPVEGVTQENAEIRVPDQFDETEITVEDGQVSVPAEVTGLQIHREPDSDETNDGSDSSVIVEVPDEMIPDEEQTIGREEPVTEEEPAEPSPVEQPEPDDQPFQEQPGRQVQRRERNEGPRDFEEELSIEDVAEPEVDTNAGFEQISFAEPQTDLRQKELLASDQQDDLDLIQQPRERTRGSQRPFLDTDTQTSIDTDLNADTGLGLSQGIGVDTKTDTAQTPALDTRLDTNQALAFSGMMATSSEPAFEPELANENREPNENRFNELQRNRKNGKRKRLPDLDFDATGGGIENPFGGDEQRYDFGDIDIL